MKTKDKHNELSDVRGPKVQGASIMDTPKDKHNELTITDEHGPAK